MRAATLAAFREFEPALPPVEWAKWSAHLADVEARRRHSQTIVAVECGVVGVVDYSPSSKSELRVGATARYLPAEWAVLSALGIAPQFRGSGIGKRLVEECLRRARRDCEGALGLLTLDVMTAGKCLYRGLGFRRHARVGVWAGHEMFAYVLQLDESGPHAANRVTAAERELRPTERENGRYGRNVSWGRPDSESS